MPNIKDPHLTKGKNFFISPDKWIFSCLDILKRETGDNEETHKNPFPQDAGFMKSINSSFEANSFFDITKSLLFVEMAKNRLKQYLDTQFN